MGKISKWTVLLVSVAVFLISMGVLYMALTSGGSVRARKVDFVTDEGVSLSATLFIPDSVSAENPGAGIVICPGGNTPHVFYAGYSIELARRGYVVLAYDYYGTVESGVSAAGSSGAVAAAKYLSGLSFVDPDRLGATGHSNGGAQALAAVSSASFSDASRRSVIFIGCGLPSPDLSSYSGLNVMAVWGKLDECGQGTFWDVAHEESLDYADFSRLVGLDDDDIVPGTIYGDDGEVRVVYTPNTFHSMSNLVPSSVENIIRFFDSTLEGNTSTLPDDSFIYVFQEFAVLIAALALCVMIFPVGGLLLETRFFSCLRREVPEATSKLDLRFIIFFLVPPLISTFLIKSTIIQGQVILGKIPHILNVQSTNGFIWWFFLSALVALGSYAVKVLADKTIDRNAERLRAQASLTDIAKAVLLSLLTVGIPYLCSVIGYRLTGWYSRIFQTYLAPVHSTRLSQYVVYYVLFFILFSVYAFLHTDGLRLKGLSDRKNYWVMFLENALPALLFLIWLYGYLILTHVTLINGREMSRAQGAMMGMVILYFVIARNVTDFYKKTGNIYVVAAMNAAFVTWLSVNTQQLMV